MCAKYNYYCLKTLDSVDVNCFIFVIFGLHLSHIHLNLAISLTWVPVNSSLYSISIHPAITIPYDISRQLHQDVLWTFKPN